jgi:hypothetical protein
MKELLSKISEVKSEIGTLSKNASNPFFKSKYLDLGEILSNLEPILQKHKLLLLQPVLDNSVYTEIHDLESGEIIKSAIPLPNIQDPQKIGSAITYYRRYSLQSLLALQTDDDDGNKASQPTKVQVENSIPNFLNNSKTLEDLATNYKTLSKDDQKKYAQLTSELKLKLSNTK